MTPFRLINPPNAEAEAVVVATLDAVGFPWDSLNPDELAATDGIRVEWTDDMVPNTASGLYYAGSNRIVLKTSRATEPTTGFVLAHELGHMVDDLVLTDTARDQLLEVMHPGATIGHIDRHDHPDAGHAETWSNSGDSYIARIYEAWADVFVATYAPAIWDGTALGTGTRYPRFIHWTADTAAVRAIVDPLTAPTITTAAVEPEPVKEQPMFRDVPDTHPARRAIERAVRLGLMEPRRNGRFRPRRKITRAEMARIALRLYDQK